MDAGSSGGADTSVAPVGALPAPVGTGSTDVGGDGDASSLAATVPMPDGPLNTRCVIGFVGMLNEAIEQGVVPKPVLMNHNEWKSWRSQAGLRPTVSRGMRGSKIFTTAKEEVILWKHAMQANFGMNWKEDLQKLKADKVPEEVKAVPLGGAAAPLGDLQSLPRAAPLGLQGLPAGALGAPLAVLGASAGPPKARIPAILFIDGVQSAHSSLPGSPRGLRARALEYDPTELSLEKYEKRLVRIAEHLDILGAPFTESERAELVHVAV